MQGSLPQRLRVLRAERRLTLREAAALTDVRPGTLSELERGLRHPHDITLSRIAKGYDIPIEELLEEEQSPKAPSPSSPVIRFVEAAGQLERLAEEEPQKLREHLGDVRENAYPFAKRHVEALPSGPEKDHANAQLLEGQEKLSRALMLLLSSPAGADLRVEGAPRPRAADAGNDDVEPAAG